MADNKTRLTAMSVEHYLASIADEVRRKDCEALVKIMTRATGLTPQMWGTAIVGFGVRKYAYESGRTGEICLVGFSARKGDISIYGTGSAPRRDALLTRLGKHKTGKACLYIGHLKDVDVAVLEELIAESAQPGQD